MREFKTIILPSREEMRKRLVKGKNIDHYRQNLYPLFLERAGTEIDAPGIVLFIALTLYDYTKDMAQIIAAAVPEDTEIFIEAMVTDPEVVAEAKEHLKKVRAMSKKK